MNQKEVTTTIRNVSNFRFEIHNQIRAYIFKEYQLPVIKNKKIKKTILLDEKIDTSVIIEEKDCFVISGIDSYKIIAYKDED